MLDSCGQRCDGALSICSAERGVHSGGVTFVCAPWGPVSHWIRHASQRRSCVTLDAPCVASPASAMPGRCIAFDASCVLRRVPGPGYSNTTFSVILPLKGSDA